jgi:hypothetical protein
VKSVALLLLPFLFTLTSRYGNVAGLIGEMIMAQRTIKPIINIAINNIPGISPGG